VTLTVPPLTPQERAWVRRLARVLADCPARLELLTVGDRWLAVVDAAGASSGDLHDGAAGTRGIELATVHGPRIHGVSG